MVSFKDVLCLWLHYVYDLLDNVVIFSEGLFVDDGVEFDVFVSDPLFSGDRQDVVSTHDLEAHPLHVIDTELHVRHA